MGYFPYLHMIEYCRLNIDYLRSACGGSIFKRPIKKWRSEATSTNIQYSIFNSQLWFIPARPILFDTWASIREIKTKCGPLARLGINFYLALVFLD